MKKGLATACAGLLAVWPAAAQQKARVPAAPGRPPTAESRSNFLAHAGGFVKLAASGPAITLVSVQSRVKAAVLEETLETMRKHTRLPYALADRKGTAAITAATETLAGEGVGAVIVVADEEGWPPLLVAPEARWAVVNVAALETKGVSPEVYESRVKKTLWRALGYVMGAANSAFPSCVLKSVFKPEDLDGIKIEMLCPEPFGKLMTQGKLLGMVPATQATYRKACEDGWAPAPTNDVQRAIWDEIKAGKQ